MVTSDSKYRYLYRVAAGDFVISDINAINGAIAVIPDERDGLEARSGLLLLSTGIGRTRIGWDQASAPCRHLTPRRRSFSVLTAQRMRNAQRANFGKARKGREPRTPDGQRNGARDYRCLQTTSLMMHEQGVVLDEDVTKHLVRCAKALGISVNDVLRRVLNVTPLSQDPRFDEHVQDRSQQVVQLLESFDERIRERNPGSQYVIRATYIGYRRPGKMAPGPQKIVAGQRADFETLWVLVGVEVETW